MAPFLIVLALLALGVGIVVWSVRRPPARAAEAGGDQGRAWNDPVSPPPADPATRDADPFAHAPPPSDDPEGDSRIDSGIDPGVDSGVDSGGAPEPPRP